MKPHSVKLTNPKEKAKLEEMLQDNSGYIAERKYDGCHYQAIGGRFFNPVPSNITGQLVEKTDRVPHLHEVLSLPALDKAVFDGELIYPGGKSQDVITISGCLADEAVRRQEHGPKLEYVIFDILRSPSGEWLFNKPWSYRHAYLQDLINALKKYTGWAQYLSVSEFVTNNKKSYLDSILSEGLEGIVLKKMDGFYIPGTPSGQAARPRWNWVKFKVESSDDFIIMGWDPPEMTYTGKDPSSWSYWEHGLPVTKFYSMGWPGAVRFGKFNHDGHAVYIGSCSGMTEQVREDMSSHPEAYLGKVVEINYMELTPEGCLRHPRFKQMRPDKTPQECSL